MVAKLLVDLLFNCLMSIMHIMLSSSTGFVVRVGSSGGGGGSGGGSSGTESAAAAAVQQGTK